MKRTQTEFIDLKNITEKETVIRIQETKHEHGC